MKSSFREDKNDCSKCYHRNDFHAVLEVSIVVILPSKKWKQESTFKAVSFFYKHIDGVFESSAKYKQK